MVKNLKALRIKNGISQQALAEKLGISQQSVNKYENHKIEPDISTLVAMADYFDVTVDYLIGRTTEDGKRLSKSDADELTEKYMLLKTSEKTCVNVLIDTFIKQKNKKTL